MHEAATKNGTSPNGNPKKGKGKRSEPITPSVQQATPKKRRELTVNLIIYLLADRSRSKVVYTDKDGNSFKIGSAPKLAKLTGLCRSSISRGIRFFKSKDEYVHYEPSSLIGLAHLLEQLDPPLYDPEDPDRTPIVFHDTEINGEVLEGWELLSHLNTKLKPFRDEWMRSRLLTAVTPDEPEEIEAEETEAPQPVSNTPGLTPKQEGDAAKILAEAIQADITRLGLKTISDYAKYLIDLRSPEDPKAKLDRRPLEGAIADILYNSTIPTKRMLTYFADYTPSIYGDRFERDINQLFRYMGIER